MSTDGTSTPHCARATAAAGRATAAQHFALAASKAASARITLNRPERKNPLTFESYAELRDLFRALRYATDVQGVVVTGAGGNFCSGGDVHEIIGPLIALKAPELLMFTRMTGDLVKAMRALPAADRRRDRRRLRRRRRDRRDGVRPALGTARSKTAFLFNRVGLAGCDMGACAHAAAHRRPGPRQRAALHRPRDAAATRAQRWGFFNRLVAARGAARRGQALARELAAGPTFANGITKTMLHQEWDMGIDQAIEAEAQAQAICMLTEDFKRAYQAFVAKGKPRFEGN